MAVGNFKESDLVGKSLERLLDEIEVLATSGEVKDYQTLKSFTEELYKVTSNATLSVTRPDGKKMMTIRGEEVDVTETLNKIVGKINSEIGKNEADTKQDAAREELKKTISSTIAVLLKEDEIMQELSHRNLTPEEFIKNAEAEIAKSESRVTDLEALQKDVKAQSDLFGKTQPLMNKGGYLSKSQITKLEKDKESVALMNNAKEISEKISKLKKAAKTMSTDSEEYKANMDAIQNLMGDMKGITASLKSFDIKEMDFSNLEKLKINSETQDFEDISKEMGKKQTQMENNIINDDYTVIKATIKANFAQFGFKSEAEVDGIDLSKKDGKARIDSIISEIKSNKQKVANQIKYEQNYQQEMKDSIEKYRSIVERHNEVSKKITIKTREVELKDENGNFIDQDGKPLPEGATPIKVQQKYYDYTDEALGEVYKDAGFDKDIDEVAYRKEKEEQAERRAKAEAESLTRKEKRKLIRADYRKDGKKHPIKFLRSFFRPGSYWKKEYANQYLSDITSREVAQAKKDADKYLSNKEEAYKQDRREEAIERAEQSAKSLTRKEKRDLIRADYRDDKKHPIKFLRSFARPGSYWEKEYAEQYLSDLTAQEVAKAEKDANKYLQEKIEEPFQKYADEFEFTQDILRGIRSAYKQNIISAVAQEKMTDELSRGTTYNNGIQQDTIDNVKLGATRGAASEAIRAASKAEMHAAVEALNDKKISESEFEAIRNSYQASVNNKSKVDNREAIDRAYISELSNIHADRKSTTPTYKDQQKPKTRDEDKER